MTAVLLDALQRLLRESNRDLDKILLKWKCIRQWNCIMDGCFPMRWCISGWHMGMVRAG